MRKMCNSSFKGRPWTRPIIHTRWRHSHPNPLGLNFPQLPLKPNQLSLRPCGNPRPRPPHTLAMGCGAKKGAELVSVPIPGGVLIGREVTLLIGNGQLSYNLIIWNFLAGRHLAVRLKQFVIYSYPDHNRPSHNGYNIPKSSSASQMPSSGGLQQQEQTATYGFTKQQSMPALRPPAYRQPPPGPARNSSPAEPPPYREPPPPGSVRPPHYSPPPTHRSTHLSRHPSRSSLGGSRGNNSGGFPQHHGLPYRQQQSSIQPPTQPPQPPQPSFTNYQGFPASSSSTDFSELMNLVTAQQSTLQNQHSDMKQVLLKECIVYENC